MKKELLSIGDVISLKGEPKSEVYTVTRIQFIPDFGNVITIMDYKGNLYTVHIDDIVS